MRGPSPTIRATLRGLVVALLAFASVTEAQAEPGIDEPEVTEPRGVSSVIVASVLGEGEEVRAQVEAQLLEDLEGEDTSTPDGEPVVIVISGASDDAAALRVEYRHGDQEVYEWTCRCSALELQEQLPGHTTEALRLARAATEPVPAPVLAAPPPQSVPDPLEQRRTKRAVGMFGSGLMMTTLGGSAVVAGGTALIVGAAAKADMPLWAVVVTATGGATVAVGVPLLVIGERRTRSSRQASVRLVPAGSGLALRGRF